MDLTKSRENGKNVDSKEIGKQRNDVFKPNLLLPDDAKINLPDAIRRDLNDFFDMVDPGDIPLKKLEYVNPKPDEVVVQLKAKYDL